MSPRQTPYSKDDMTGQPIIPHRPLMLCTVLGGGNWIVSALPLIAFVTHVTGYRLHELYDGFIGNSAGAVILGAALKPRHQGSHEPAFQNMRDILLTFEQNARERVFPPKQVRWFDTIPFFRYERTAQNFINRRLYQEIKGAIVNIVANKISNAYNMHACAWQHAANIFDPLHIREQIERPNYPKTKRLIASFIRAATASILDTTDAYGFAHVEGWRQRAETQAKKIRFQAEAWLDTRAAKRREQIYADHHALRNALRDTFETPNPTPGTPATDTLLKDVIAPFVIPAIQINDTGNQYFYFAHPPVAGQTLDLPRHIQHYYTEDITLADAVHASCLLPGAFMTAPNPAGDGHVSDGGSAFTIRRGVEAMLPFFCGGSTIFGDSV